MTKSKDRPSAQEVVTDLLDATARTILDIHDDLAELGSLFAPVTDAILFLKQHGIDPPPAAYRLLFQLITSGAAASAANEE